MLIQKKVENERGKAFIVDRRASASCSCSSFLFSLSSFGTGSMDSHAAMLRLIVVSSLSWMFIPLPFCACATFPYAHEPIKEN